MTEEDLKAIEARAKRTALGGWVAGEWVEGEWVEGEWVPNHALEDLPELAKEVRRLWALREPPDHADGL